MVARPASQQQVTDAAPHPERLMPGSAQPFDYMSGGVGSFNFRNWFHGNRRSVVAGSPPSTRVTRLLDGRGIQVVSIAEQNVHHTAHHAPDEASGVGQQR